MFQFCTFCGGISSPWGPQATLLVKEILVYLVEATMIQNASAVSTKELS